MLATKYLCTLANSPLIFLTLLRPFNKLNVKRVQSEKRNHRDYRFIWSAAISKTSFTNRKLFVFVSWKTAGTLALLHLNICCKRMSSQLLKNPPTFLKEHLRNMLSWEARKLLYFWPKVSGIGGTQHPTLQKRNNWSGNSWWRCWTDILYMWNIVEGDDDVPNQMTSDELKTDNVFDVTAILIFDLHFLARCGDESAFLALLNLESAFISHPLFLGSFMSWQSEAMAGNKTSGEILKNLSSCLAKSIDFTRSKLGRPSWTERDAPRILPAWHAATQKTWT